MRVSIKAMNNQNAQGGNFLVSNIIGGSAKKYNSLDEIKNDKSRLQNVNDEEYNQIRNNLYKRFQEIAQSMTKNDNPFAVADIIVEGVAKTETKSGLANYLKTELKGWANYSDMAVDDIWILVNDIRALPTSYFEAKPQRAVYFNEVYTAVIPDNASQKLKNALKNAGVSYAEYKANNEQSRLDVVNSLEDIRFSRDVNYSYNELIKKPDMKITKIDDSIEYEANASGRKNIIETAINNAKKIGKVNENGNAVIYVDDIKTDIIVSKSAIRHSLDRRLSINAPVVINVGNILKNSIRINELIPRSEHIEKSYALIGIAKNNNNEPYIVSFVVNRHSNEIQSIDVLYAVNAKKEVAALDEPEFRPINGAALTTSTISISNLLDYVNNYFPDILPESVLKHYGYSSRPEGNIGESALFSRDVDYAEYAELKRENKHLKEINEVLKHQFELTNGREVSTNSLLIAARKIIKLTPTRMTGVDVAQEMKSWHTLDTSQQFFNAAYDLAQKLVENERQLKYQPTQEEQEMLQMSIKKIHIHKKLIVYLTNIDYNFVKVF